MPESDGAPAALTFDELIGLREKTECISDFLSKRLRGHLATLYPILAPRRIFGKFVGSRDSVPRAEEAYAQLCEKFKDACGSPFDLRSDLDDEALSSVEYGIQVYPWEYTYEARNNRESKKITLASPVRWVVTYGSEYSLSEIRNVATLGRGERKPAAIRHFVVNALALQVVLARSPGVTQILRDLRYEVTFETGAGLGKLPLVIFSTDLPSFRPPDELILTAVRFSGVPAFIELIDTQELARLEDPFRSQIGALLRPSE